MHTRLLLLGLLISAFCIPGSYAQFDPSQYNISWTTQSKNSGESMPVGGFDIGCNVWVENGEIYFYFGRSNSFDENNALMKSGRIKISISPNPFEKITQELKLANGFIEIMGESKGLKVSGRIWVEHSRPVIHAELKSIRNIELKAEYQNWRYQQVPINTRWVVPSYIDYPGNDIYWFPDSVKQVKNNVMFYHRNNNDHLVIDKEIDQQDLAALRDSLWNPLRNFVFGGMISGTGLVPAGETSGSYLGTSYKAKVLKTKKPSRNIRIDISLASGYIGEHKQSYVSWADSGRARLVHTDQLNWEKSLEQNHADALKQVPQQFAAHQQWWKNFWQKSWIRMNNNPADTDKPGTGADAVKSNMPGQTNEKDPVWQVARNYNIVRYQLACNSRGEYPTKFNGGLFTTDPVNVDTAFAKDNSDFRAWGGGVMTAQNQRLLYWPLLKTGDFEMMPQQFDFYRRALDNAELRTKHYWNHAGACFTDQMNQAGIVCGREYGWSRPKGMENGRQNTLYHEYYFTSQLEFAFMMLEYFRFAALDIKPYLRFIKSAITFFDEHYRMLSMRHFGAPFSGEGKYNFYPCMALETYTGHVRNPSDVIAALNVLTSRLQTLPDEYVSAKEKEWYREMKSRLPKAPERILNGVRTIAPAEHWDKIINVEIPQLYPVFPWGIYSVGKPDLELAINTWKYGVDNKNQKDFISWHQDAIFCARMGLTEEAAAITVKKLSDSQRRFPTFWGPGHDWVPDHNHGGSGMIGLQEMLLQTVDEKIYLLPAWPKNWDVDCKLHAPGKTTIEFSYRNGKIENLKVLPESRKKDLVFNSSLLPVNDTIQPAH